MLATVVSVLLCLAGLFQQSQPVLCYPVFPSKDSPCICWQMCICFLPLPSFLSYTNAGMQNMILCVCLFSLHVPCRLFSISTYEFLHCFMVGWQSIVLLVLFDYYVLLCHSLLNHCALFKMFKMFSVCSLEQGCSL